MKSDKLAGRLVSTFLEGDAVGADVSPQREFSFTRDETLSELRRSLEAEYGTMILGGGDGDILRGGAGPDRLLGWASDDRLFGGVEDDKLFGGAGDDVLFGGAGRDRLKGGEGGDRLFGGRGADRIQADGSDKLVRAGGGQDKVVVELAGETGQMTRLFGGAGTDKLVLKIDFDAYGPDQAAGVLADLAALAAHIEAENRSALTLRTLGIKVKGFEKLALREVGDRPVAAADDEIVTGENDPVVFSPLANDAGAVALARIDGQDIEIGDVISLAAGLLEIGADNSVTFTPNSSAQGLGDGEQIEDSFTYQAVSGAGVLGPEATVRIVIEGASDPVIILPDTGVPNSGASGAPLIISGVAINLPQNESGVVEVAVSTEDGEIAFTDDTDVSRLTLIDNDGADGVIAFSGAPEDVTKALANSLKFTSKSGFSGTAKINVSANDAANKDLRVEEIIEIPIDLTDAPPVLDLNGDAAGTDAEALYRPERGPAAVIGDAARISDPNGAEISAILIKADFGAIPGDRLTLDGGLALRMDIIDDFDGLGPAVASLDRRPRSIGDFEEALARLRFSNSELEAATTTLEPSDIRLVDRVVSLRAVDPDGNIGPDVFATIDVEQNLPPVIQPLNIAIDEDAAFQGRLIAADPNGDELAFELSADKPPQKGVVTVDKVGLITYQPRADANGSDNFIVLVTDGDRTAAELVGVNITPVNDAPIVEALDVDLPLSRMLNAGIAAKDREEAPLTFSLTEGPAKGQIDFRPDGSFTYRADFLEPGGVDEFTFTVSDGELDVTEVARINLPQGVANFGSPDFFTVAPDGRLSASLIDNDDRVAPVRPGGGSEFIVFDGLAAVGGFELVTSEAGESLQPVSFAFDDERTVLLLSELGGQIAVSSRGALNVYTPPETFIDAGGVERAITSLAPDEEVVDRFFYQLAGTSFTGFPLEEPFGAPVIVEITIRQPDATPVLDLNGALDGIDGEAAYLQGEGAQAVVGDVAITDDDSEEFAFVRLTLSNADGAPDAGGVLTLSAEVAETFDLIIEQETPEAATVYRLEAQSGEAASAEAFEAALQGLTYENAAIDARGATGPGADFRDRRVEAVISDGELLSDPVILTIAIDPIDAPVLDLNGASEGVDVTVTYVQGDGAQALFGPELSISSDEGATFAFARLELSIPSAGGANPFDRLELADEATTAFDLQFEGLFDDVGAVYRLAPLSDQPAGAAAFETALQGLRFLGQNIEDPAIPGGADLNDRLVRASVFDGFQMSAFADAVITIDPNAPPTLDLNGADDGVDSFARYRPGDGPQDVFVGDIVISDDENSQIEFITFKLGFADGGDIDILSQLALDDFTAGQFDLSFEGVADGDAIYRLAALDGAARSSGAFAGALRGVEFVNPGLDNPDAAADLGLTPDFGGREVEVRVFDGFGGSNVATVDISSIANVAPTLDGVGGAFGGLNTYFQGDGAQMVFPDATRVVDPDSETLAFITFSLTADRRSGDIRNTLIDGDRLELIGASTTDFVLDGPDITPPLFPGGAPLSAGYTLRPLSGAADLEAFDAALQDLHFFSQGLEDPVTADPLDVARLAAPRFIDVTLSDGIDQFDFGQLTLAVDPNLAPRLDEAEFATDEDAPLIGQFVAFDPDDRPVTYTLGDQAPALGAIELAEDGAFTYTPNANVFGEDSFTVDLSDGFHDVESVITITIAPVNDAPVAEDAAVTAAEGEAIQGQVAATDIEGDAIVFSSSPEQAPSSGDLTLGPDGAFSFMPDAGFVGEVTFGFTADDQNGGVDDGVVTLTYTPASSDGVQPQADVATTDEDAPVLIDVLANDDIGDNATVTLSITGDPTFGEAIVQGNMILYRPDANASGQDSFTYRIVGDQSGDATGEVTVDVAPVADAPALSVQRSITSDDGFAPRQRVNDEAAFDQDQPQILMLATGELFYVYRVSDDSGVGPHIAFRIGTAATDGSITFGAEHVIPDEGDGTTVESRPQAIQLSSGEVLVAWQSADQSGAPVGVRVVDISLEASDGPAPLPVFGDIAEVNQDTDAAHGEVSLTQLSSGEVLFSWTHSLIDEAAGGVAARLGAFDADTGFAFGDEMRVNATPDDAQGQSRVVELPDGRALFVYRSDADAADGDGSAIVARIGAIGAGGAFSFGDEILINQTVAGEQTAPDVKLLSTGDLVFVWDDGQAVRSRIGEIDGTGALTLGDEFVASLLSQTEVHRSGSVIETTPGRLLYTWVTDAVGEQGIFDAFYRFGDLNGSGGVNFEIEDLVHDATRFADEESVSAAHLGADTVAFVWASEDPALEPEDANSGFGVATRTFDPADVSGPFLQLTVTTALQDDDGSEGLGDLTLSGAPDGFQFRRNGDLFDSDGADPVVLSDLESVETLSVFAPAGFDGALSLTLSAASVETATDESAATDRSVFQSYSDGSPFLDA